MSEFPKTVTICGIKLYSSLVIPGWAEAGWDFGDICLTKLKGADIYRFTRVEADDVIGVSVHAKSLRSAIRQLTSHMGQRSIVCEVPR